MGPFLPRIALRLLQFPPSFLPTERNIERLKKFFEKVKLGNSAGLEFRDGHWQDFKDVLRSLVHIAFSSVDGPSLPRNIVAINSVTYLRLYGREDWYSYIYTENRQAEIVHEVMEKRACKKYIYLKNDRGMLIE